MELTTHEEDIGKRLDVFVTEHMPEFSRSSVQKLCEQGKILVNNEVEKTRYNLREADVVTINYDHAQSIQVPEIDLQILYEDNDCIVVNKPEGLLTHSKGAFNPEATVATFIGHKTKGMDSDRSGIVHRLDRATSGVIICAKTPEALSHLQKQFAQRKAKKTYIAVIEGTMDPPEAIIDMPIERNPKDPKTFRVGTNGKIATTQYKTLKANDTYSLLELTPTTGRTHQLRVHLKQQGHPIVGDTIYGGKPHKRMMLHAYHLEITLPSKERVTFSAPLPADFDAIMK